MNMPKVGECSSPKWQCIWRSMYAWNELYKYSCLTMLLWMHATMKLVFLVCWCIEFYVIIMLKCCELLWKSLSPWMCIKCFKCHSWTKIPKWGSIVTLSKWAKVSRASHELKKFNMLNKVFCSLHNWFEVIWRSNVQDVGKLGFRRASESLYICLVFMCFLELRGSVVDSSTLIDMLMAKTPGYDSLSLQVPQPENWQELLARRCWN